MGQEPYVICDFVECLGNARHNRQRGGVDLARIGLARNGHGGAKPHFCRNQQIEALYLCLIAVEQAHVACLRARCSLDAKKRQGRVKLFERREVERELVQPQARALSHGGELRGLKMGVAQGREVFVCKREFPECRNNRRQPREQECRRFPELDEIGVVAHERAGGPQVNDGARERAAVPERVYVGHHVVPGRGLVGGRGVVVDVVDMLLHLVDLLGRDRKAKVFLAFGKGYPQLSPRAELEVGREDIQHLPAGIALEQGIYIDVGPVPLFFAHNRGFLAGGLLPRPRHPAPLALFRECNSKQPRP